MLSGVEDRVLKARCQLKERAVKGGGRGRPSARAISCFRLGASVLPASRGLRARATFTQSLQQQKRLDCLQICGVVARIHCLQAASRVGASCSSRHCMPLTSRPCWGLA